MARKIQPIGLRGTTPGQYEAHHAERDGAKRLTAVHLRALPCQQGQRHQDQRDEREHGAQHQRGGRRGQPETVPCCPISPGHGRTLRPDRSGNVTAQREILSKFKGTNWSRGDSLPRHATTPGFTTRCGRRARRGSERASQAVCTDASHDDRGRPSAHRNHKAARRGR